MRAFSSAVSGGYSLLWCTGFSLRWLLLLQSTGSRCVGFSSCGTGAQQLWHMGLVALQHVGSSPTRARTRVPYIGRRILNHCATRGVPDNCFLNLGNCLPRSSPDMSARAGERCRAGSEFSIDPLKSSRTEEKARENLTHP